MPTSYAMETLIGSIGDVIEFVFGTVGDTIGAIVSNPVLTFALCLPLAGIGISIVQRLLGTRL